MTKVIKQAWIICLILLPWAGKTQETIITGKITDVTTGAPIPFANVFFINTNIGATTDFEGYYRIVADHPDDSLTASYIGYKTKSRSVIPGQSQTIHFQLEEDVYNLEEVVFYAGENPAFPILRKVIEHKNKNDKRRLDAFEYESYTKTQISIDNITEDFKHTGLMMKISHILDSIEVIAGEDGEAILPIFISEAISKMYYKRPQLRHEKIIKTKISGVGITDGTLTSQVIGSSFQEYNFYQNWLNIVEKEFISPIADGWRAYYDYFLVDSLYIGDHYCYRLEVSPKQSQDLAFTGTLWVTKNEYALKQIDVTVNRSANLNFIEKIKLQQELEPTEEGPWIPVKTRVLIDVAKLTNNMASVIANFYVSNKNIKVNNAYKDAFYMLPIKMDPEVRNYDPDFWRNNRHDSLTGTEINVYKMIDTLKTITEIKLMTDLSKFLATGYHKIGKIEIGPYSTFFADNDVEGIRIGLGARTSIDFSNKVILGGGVGYGFDDQRWKYSGYFGFIVDRDPWTKLTLNHQLEVDPVWVLNDDVGTRSLFYAYSRFSIMVDPYLHTESGLRFERQIGTGLVQRLNVKHQDFKPLYDFQYFLEPGSTDSPTKTDFKTTEINFETRFGKDELWIVNDNERVSLGTIRWPVLKLRYTLGIKGPLGGDFDYHKLVGSIRKDQKMGFLGKSLFKISAGYIFSRLPYPLLENHIGNESPFYIGFSHNLMDYFEFSSDRWVSIKYRHHFEGLWLNRVPLLKKLKWRLTGSANVLWGGMREENLKVVPPIIDANGNEMPRFQTLNEKPYIELGYGIENIFKIFRVDAFHRLTYLENPDTRKFGVKFSMQFML